MRPLSIHFWIEKGTTEQGNSRGDHRPDKDLREATFLKQKDFPSQTLPFKKTLIRPIG